MAVELKPGEPLLRLHGRWDKDNTSWWAGSGFDIVASDLSSITVHCGALNGKDLPVGVSINYAPYETQVFNTGANVIPLPPSVGSKKAVVRFAVEAWEFANLHLLSVNLNEGAKPEAYKPQKLKFQFIGDSHSSGQYCKRQVVDCFDWIVAEELKAEKDINAQPGAALTDIECWGNVHGLTFQFFKTEDTRYYYNPKHNYVTDWDFARDDPPTHIVLFVGANDGSERYNVPVEEFTETYKKFVDLLREKYYKEQPIFIFTNWGKFKETGALRSYYDNPSPYHAVQEYRTGLGDKNVFVVDTHGWIGSSELFTDNGHCHEEGQKVVAMKFLDWLREWGLKGEDRWEAAE